MQRLLAFLKRPFSGVNHTALIVATVVAFGLWYINKLGHVYTATVVLPVSITGSADSRAGVLENQNEVECRVEGTGYELLRYRLFPRRNVITIPVDHVELAPIARSDRSEVSLSSLFSALSAQMTDLRLLSIVTPRIEVATAPMRSRQVPVQSRISVRFQSNFRATGPMRFNPKTVEIRSLDPLIDTLTAVCTERQEYTGINGSLSGRVALVPIPGVIFSTNEVEFDLPVEPVPVEEPAPEP